MPRRFPAIFMFASGLLTLFVWLIDPLGALILRRDSLGYLIAVPLLVLEAMLAPMITAQTVSQVRAGVSFTPGEMVGPIAGFAALGLVAIWVIVAILRNVSNLPPSQAARS